MFKYFAILFFALSAAVPGTLAFVFHDFIANDLAEPNEFPYMAAVLVKHGRKLPTNCNLIPNKCIPLYPSHDFHCNSVIISRQFILTTAQCILSRKNELHKIRIRTGTNSLWDGKGETHEVQSYQVHNITKSETGKNVVYHTIGVYKLKTPLKVNDRQKPIQFSSLPQNIITRDFSDMQIFFSGLWYGTAVGWGVLDPRGTLKNGIGSIQRHYVPKLLKMSNTVVIERFPRCKRFMQENRIPYVGYEVCAYLKEKMGNNGAALLYDNHFIGVAIHFKYTFDMTVYQKHDWSYGSLFAYIQNLKDFILTATDYYEA